MVGPKRENHENTALGPFRDILTDRGLPFCTGQKANNRIYVDDTTWYQFGDLRFSEGDQHLIVEVESAGGVTNLAKYWYLLRNNVIEGRLYLLHVFWRETSISYQSHLVVWDMLRNEIEEDLSGRFRAWRYSYSPDSHAESLREPVKKFRSLLPESA